MLILSHIPTGVCFWNKLCLFLVKETVLEDFQACSFGQFSLENVCASTVDDIQYFGGCSVLMIMFSTVESFQYQ